MAKRIFVQIPAYRDSELPPTLRDLLEQASDPSRLRVAVAWQYGDDELHLESGFRQLKNVQLLKIHSAESQGCNWARSLLQKKWDGEPYTLFLDSHHRFAPGWDEQTIRMFENLRSSGVARPILTSYLPPYDPWRDPEGRHSCVLAIRAEGRYRGLLFRLVGEPVQPTSSILAAPIPAKFASLHFLFSEGSLNEMVAFDSSIYFFVDEIAIALRAYTHGYDLFHPHRTLGWHLYDRTTRVAHWQDHAEWGAQYEVSYKRALALFCGRLTGRYGVGSTRSVAQYEAIVGERLVA